MRNRMDRQKKRGKTVRVKADRMREGRRNSFRVEKAGGAIPGRNVVLRKIVFRKILPTKIVQRRKRMILKKTRER